MWQDVGTQIFTGRYLPVVLRGGGTPQLAPRQVSACSRVGSRRSEPRRPTSPTRTGRDRVAHISCQSAVSTRPQRSRCETQLCDCNAGGTLMRKTAIGIDTEPGGWGQIVLSMAAHALTRVKNQAAVRSICSHEDNAVFCNGLSRPRSLSDRFALPPSTRLGRGRDGGQ